MSAPAPSPPPGAPPSPPPPPPERERGVFYCDECGSALPTAHRVCQCCYRGFLVGNPPPPPLPPPPPPAPLEPALFYCHECGRTVDLHMPPPVPAPSSRACPGCSRGFVEENTPPPSSPPPAPGSGSGSGSSSSELSDDPEDDDADVLGGGDFDAGREFIRAFGSRGSRDMPLRNYTAAVTMSALRHHNERRGLRYAFNDMIPRHLDLPPAPAAAAAAAAARGGEPPAPATSIAALPTVEVAEPAAACAICKEDLPLASQARKLPCTHLYHSSCIVTWLELHNSCPVCRYRIPSASGLEGAVAPAEPDSPTTRITIRFTTSTRRRSRVLYGDAAVPAPISASPTQLAQAVTGDGAGGPANSGETVSSEWPRHPESDAVMSEAREEDDSFEF